MKNILNEKDRQQIVARINKVAMDSTRLWGKMDPNEMLCHSADQIRLALGEKKSGYNNNVVKSAVLRTLVLWGMPAPKGKVETFNELKQGEGGTPVTNINGDKEILVEKINTFVAKPATESLPVHPAFGKMNFDQWGRLIYIHLDHHLKQFGC